MRKYGVRGKTVTVHLRNSVLKSISRQTALTRPTFAAAEIAEAALSLVKANWSGEPLRTVTVTVSDLVSSDGCVQADMFDRDPYRNERLEKALDSIKAKYGKSAVMRADLIESDFVYDKNEGEDFLPFKR